MRKALQKENLLPKAILSARKKAFYFPYEKCFDKQFDHFIREFLSEASIKKRGLFNPRYIQDLLNRSERELVQNKQLMTLLVFEMWCRLFLDNEWRNGIYFSRN